MGDSVLHKPNRPKKPIIPGQISTHKVPRYLGIPNIEEGHLAWRFSNADITGPYSCGTFSYADFQLLWDKLRSYEKMNVAKLREANSFHPMAVVNVSRDAKLRLQLLQLDDIDRLYSFHITSACRLWCMKHSNILSILWWDTEHKVYPVSKRHT
jgi:hypothetical protein